MGNNRSAILVFSRLPHTEAKHKIISGNLQTDVLLWQHLYEHTLDVSNSTHLPVILSCEKDQSGNSFAEKISEAISSAFNTGFENIIVLGGDFPNLTKNLIINVHRELSRGAKIVAGPDTRGGIYILGLNKAAFNKETFSEFKWQTRNLFSDIKSYSSLFSHVLLKSHLTDINSKTDAQLSTNYFSGNKSWKQLVMKVLGILPSYCRSNFNAIKSYLDSTKLALRAPPTFTVSN